jgi:glutathione synthase/RimK-type ligase-like ATP-grasp enzyme
LNRLIVTVGYIGRPVFDYDCPVDRHQIESMLAARGDDIVMTHWDDLDAELHTARGWDVRRGAWRPVRLTDADALLILEAPAPGSPFADFDRADAALRRILALGIPAVNSPRTFLEYPDKRYLVDRPDMPFPRSVLMEPGDDLEAALAGFGATVIVKPLVGAGGDGVARVPADPAAVRAALSPHGPSILQEFLPEIADGEKSLYFFAKTYRYALLKRPRPGEFRSNEEFAEHTRYEPTAAEIALAEDAVARFGSPSLIERIDLCGDRIIEMTIECPGLKISACDVHREVGHWTYEALDMAIATARPV